MSDHADTIRLALDHLIQQDRFEAPYADAAQSALDALLAENQRLRDALEQIASESEHRFPITGGSFAQIARAALAAVRVEDER